MKFSSILGRIARHLEYVQELFRNEAQSLRKAAALCRARAETASPDDAFISLEMAKRHDHGAKTLEEDVRVHEWILNLPFMRKHRKRSSSSS